MGRTGLPHGRHRSQTIGRWIYRHLLLPGAALCATGCSLRPATEAAPPQPPQLSYTATQAERGRNLYLNHCVLCHGVNLSDAQFGAPLRGAFFQSRWQGRSAAELFIVTQATMPPEHPMSLRGEEYADVLAYVLQANAFMPGARELPADIGLLQKQVLFINLNHGDTEDTENK